MAIKPDAGGAPDELPPALRAAFDAYPHPRADAAFDARFWREWDARRGRYRGLSGLLRRLFEVEIEGVAVWRLGASTLSGGVLCALISGLALGIGKAPPTPSLPSPVAQVPMMRLYAFNPKQLFWKSELWDQEATRATNEPLTSNKNTLSSCTSSKAPWA